MTGKGKAASRKIGRPGTASAKARRTGRAGGLDLAGFDAFCRSLPHTTFVQQWGDAHVWKVGGKVFAIARDDEDGVLYVSFKCSDLAFQVLSDQPGVRPAPYLASRGMKWIQRFGPETLDDEAFLEHIVASYRMIANALPKKTQVELGFLEDAAKPRAAKQRAKAAADATRSKPRKQ